MPLPHASTAPYLNPGSVSTVWKERFHCLRKWLALNNCWIVWRSVWKLGLGFYSWAEWTIRDNHQSWDNWHCWHCSSNWHSCERLAPRTLDQLQQPSLLAKTAQVLLHRRSKGVLCKWEINVVIESGVSVLIASWWERDPSTWRMTGVDCCHLSANFRNQTQLK